MGADPFLPWVLATKLALYASALFAGGIGSHIALGVVEAERRNAALRLAAMAACLALLFVGLRFVLANAQLTGSLSFSANLTSLEWTWSALGASTVALTVGATALIVAAFLRVCWLAGCAAIAVALSFALTGHTQALETPGVAPWLVGLHVLIAAFWLAAPISLWPRIVLEDAVLLRRLERFSAVAVVAVPALFLAGLWLAWRLSGGFQQLVGTAYGQLLLAKLAAAAVALAMGTINKLGTPRSIASSSSRGRALLRRTLSIESAMFVGALAIISWATTIVGTPEP